MSDIMRQIPFAQLMDWVLTEYEEENTIFGVRKLYKKTGDDTLSIFNEKLELPFGPAAGPHTQLAQNLIVSYIAGSRFFELKTVQVLDGEDLPVSKPCILAHDECYNVEWSTELYVPQAMDEYIKGWFALKLLSKELNFGTPDGFVFNMSVGYDLAGIKTEKIDNFIEGLKNAEDTDSWKACKEWALNSINRFKNIDKAYIESISPQICRSITLSTLHGCPPDEIERIAAYLLAEKNLHTFVKCNPTMLGWDYARQTLDNLGYEYITFGDHHFKADLQFDAAVPMLKRLMKLAERINLNFGVKLTNTCPVSITSGELPGEEMYMSGRSLFPLSMELANRLSKAFKGKLRISYSGGADFHNIDMIYDAGIWPITIATTLLKPGGYERLYQIAEKLDGCGPKEFKIVDTDKVQKLSDFARSSNLYHKPAGMPPNRKMKAQVPLLDCFAAPCREGCPIEQDIPAYLRLCGEGKYTQALKVIIERNPLPFITGTICSHHCAKKCTRNFYEDTVHIRNVKLEVAQKAYDALMKEFKNTSPKIQNGKVAIIGGGPAGLAAAYFLAKAGKEVTIFEKRSSLGGIVKFVIPEFRIENNVIDYDIALVKAMGIEVNLNSEILSLDMFYENRFNEIIIATGAWKPGVLKLKGESPISALEFLEELKRDPKSVNLGKNVVVVGGGNTAMDAARAAKAVTGVKKVSLVYRRTKRYMPADGEELTHALRDGVEFCELLQPISLNDGMLTCEQMELGTADESGRRSPISTGKKVDIPADTVVAAVGDLVDLKLYEGYGIPTNFHGAQFNEETLETKKQGVYIIGDAMRGPATVAEAIADALRCTNAIIGQDTKQHIDININSDYMPALNKKGILHTDGRDIHESQRCLECATICECCVDVCPNRANISLNVNGSRQIVHVDFMCNECGNCEVFCPYSSAPYLDKFTYFACEEDFNNSENNGFLKVDNNIIKVRLEGKISEHSDGTKLPKGIRELTEYATKRIKWSL